MKGIKPNLVLKNGAVYTVDKNRNWAQAIAIAEDKIVFVGSDADIEPYIEPDTVVLDLDGKMILPGFIDAHGHPSHAMDYVGNISLYGLNSLEEYQKAITEFVESHADADLYRGSGWDNALFPNLGPTKEMLDVIVPNRPVSLISYDVHSAWVNSVTLERAQINKDTPDPEGGVIERDPETGEPNGTLRETAVKLINSVIPDYSLEERKNALLAYQKMANQAGITLSHDAMLEPQSIAAYKALEAEGLLKIRFYGSIWMQPELEIEQQIETVLKERAKNKHPYFQTNAAKIFVDGVIEGGTGYLHEPYVHKPGFRGDPLWKPELLNETAVALDKENIQIHVHVIGDAATHITLNALECVQEMNGKRDS
ncbi:MAG: amidohydrolase, partial [Chloroflexi bacterium]|nr:amidohydrolase [Chloroflexota bacterium]